MGSTIANPDRVIPLIADALDRADQHNPNGCAITSLTVDSSFDPDHPAVYTLSAGETDLSNAMLGSSDAILVKTWVKLKRQTKTRGHVRLAYPAIVVGAWLKLKRAAEKAREVGHEDSDLTQESSSLGLQRLSSAAQDIEQAATDADLQVQKHDPSQEEIHEFTEHMREMTDAELLRKFKSNRTFVWNAWVDGLCLTDCL